MHKRISARTGTTAMLYTTLLGLTIFVAVTDCPVYKHFTNASASPDTASAVSFDSHRTCPAWKWALNVLPPWVLLHCLNVSCRKLFAICNGIPTQRTRARVGCGYLQLLPVEHDGTNVDVHFGSMLLINSPRNQTGVVSMVQQPVRMSVTCAHACHFPSGSRYGSFAVLYRLGDVLGIL